MPTSGAGRWKWIFFTVLVLVAGGVGAFALYIYEWRDGDEEARVGAEAGPSLTPRQETLFEQSMPVFTGIRDHGPVQLAAALPEITRACERLVAVTNEQPFARTADGERAVSVADAARSIMADRVRAIPGFVGGALPQEEERRLIKELETCAQDLEAAVDAALMR